MLPAIDRAGKPRLLAILGAGYAVLLIYASLMPFDFALGAHTPLKLDYFWDGWPVNPRARISGSDAVSNLALYIPLGWFITVRCLLGRVRMWVALMMAIVSCSLVSICVELAQSMTFSRTPSAADWVLNTVSGGAGASAGGLFGKRLWMFAIRWLRKCRQTRPLDIVTLMLMGLLVADALVPYLPTIEFKQVWRNLKHSHLDAAAGFALQPWHYWVVTRGLVAAALTMLFAVWGRQKPGMRQWLRAALLAAGFMLGLECVKPMIVSRAINVANVLASWSGSITAVLLGVSPARKLRARTKINLALVGLLAYIFYLAWMPFHFVRDLALLHKALPSPVELLPLYHYAMGADLNHARLFVQSVCLSGMLICLLRIRLGWLEGTRLKVALAAISMGSLGLLLESGQIFLPTRTPSMTDVYCFALGGGLGAWIRLPAHALLVDRPAFRKDDQAAARS